MDYASTHDDFTFIEHTAASRPRGKPKGAINRRQTLYRVQWQRGSSAMKAKLFTKRRAADDFIERLKDPDDRFNRGVRPLTTVRLSTGVTWWGDIEDML